MKLFAWNAILAAVFPWVLMAFSGCSSHEPKPVEYSLSSIADVELNRDANGRPLSVVLAIYQLREPEPFARLTFDQYVSSGDSTRLFGDSALSREELVVLPASSEKLELSLSPHATHLGVVALYRNPAAQYWHYLIPAAQLREKKFWSFSAQKTVSIHLHECHLHISGVTVEPIPGQRMDAEPVCNIPRSNSSAPLTMSQGEGGASSN